MTFAAADPSFPPAPLPAEPEPAPPRRSWIPEVLVGLAVAVVVAGLGPGLGWLWSRLAPHPYKVMLDDGPVWYQTANERVVADEGWYVVLTAGAGVVLAVLAWVLLRRFRGPIVLFGLAVGSVLAGVLTYVVGYRIGYAHAQDQLYHAPYATLIRMPVDLRAQQVGLWHGWLPFARGDVLTFGISAVLIYLLLAGFSAYPSLRPPRSDELSSD
ncbi:MAG: hypothetical protein AUG44_19005 [Actinobacteria bacterium 13_1_20CM_3_71_11]|nr:MAG: hypothetical protein AUG44_19005 [Actinobacteria bacterium 13_1_20CM_3_71_11]